MAGCGNMGLPMLRSILSKNIHAQGYDIENKKSQLGKILYFLREVFK